MKEKTKELKDLYLREEIYKDSIKRLKNKMDIEIIKNKK